MPRSCGGEGRGDAAADELIVNGMGRDTSARGTTPPAFGSELSDGIRLPVGFFDCLPICERVGSAVNKGGFRVAAGAIGGFRLGKFGLHAHLQRSQIATGPAIECRPGRARRRAGRRQDPSGGKGWVTTPAYAGRGAIDRTETPAARQRCGGVTEVCEDRAASVYVELFTKVHLQQWREVLKTQAGERTMLRCWCVYFGKCMPISTGVFSHDYTK